MSAPFNYFASHSSAFNTTAPARCSPCLWLPGRGAADLKVEGELKAKIHCSFQGKQNEMKWELKTIALVIRLMIKEMDQRETRRCNINLQDGLSTHSSMMSGCSPPWKSCTIRMLGNVVVPPGPNKTGWSLSRWKQHLCVLAMGNQDLLKYSPRASIEPHFTEFTEIPGSMKKP